MASEKVLERLFAAGNLSKDLTGGEATGESLKAEEELPYRGNRRGAGLPGGGSSTAAMWGWERNRHRRERTPGRRPFWLEMNMTSHPHTDAQTNTDRPTGAGVQYLLGEVRRCH